MVDETYIKVGNNCKYLYRAIDSMSNTIEFMLSAKRDVSAAKTLWISDTATQQIGRRPSRRAALVLAIVRLIPETEVKS